MTKSELSQYFWLKKNIEKLEHKLIELESEATRVTTKLSKEPKGGSGNQDKIGSIVVEMVSVQEKINGKIKRLYQAIFEIETAIEGLPEREAYLIRARYLHCESWEKIAVEMHYSWRQIHYIHSQALRHLA